MFALRRESRHAAAASDSASDSEFLEAFGSRLRLAVELLRVHSLSRALEFEPNSALRVDAAHWWREIKQQSEIAATQRASRKRRLQPRVDTSSGVHASSSSHSDSSPTEDHPDVIAEEFVRILSSLSAWTTRIEQVQATSPSTSTSASASASSSDVVEAAADAEEVQRIFDNIETAIGAVAVKLLHEWRERADGDAACGRELVNVLVQLYAPVGQHHAFHAHKLCASTVHRNFRTKPRWSCSKCERSWETAGAGLQVLVFRCGACAYTLCRECYTRVPNDNHADELAAVRIDQEVFQPRDLDLRRFVAVLMRQVQAQDASLFAALAPQIALAARGRLQELLLFRSQEMAPLMQLLVDFFDLPGFARLFIDAQPLEWLPLYLSSAKVRLYSFLGPLLWWTSMSDEPNEINLTPEARRDGGSATALTLQWLDGYKVLREMLRHLMHRLLLDETQDAFVADATLSFLATALAVFGGTRSNGGAASDTYDGILINLSVVLVQLLAPVLDDPRRRAQQLDPLYHVSQLPRRVYLERPEPVRKRSDQQADDEQDDERLRRQDAATLQRCAAGERVAASFYYPPIAMHFGVLCDHCHRADFTGVRYKCAFCDDADICGDCYGLFAAQRVPEEPALAAMDAAKANANHDDEDHDNDSDEAPAPDAPIHRADHLFLRLDVPVPLMAATHFFPNRVSRPRVRYTAAESEESIAHLLRCGGCDADLADAAVLFKCSNCLASSRFRCGDCVAHEERHRDPSQMHLPGHTYYAVPKAWREQFNPCVGDALVFRGLFYPACVYPRERLSTETELLFLAIKSLHIGPLLSLGKLLTTVKELFELKAFCACEEQRVAFEKSHHPANKPPKLSAHYAASQARYADLSATRLLAELHLLEPRNVAAWVRFYSRTSRWLLESCCSSSQDAFAHVVTAFAPRFLAFPEHFFFDLCDAVQLLSLDGDSPSLDFASVWLEDQDASSEAQDATLEALAAMLLQLVATRKLSKNPHLRVQAAKALAVLLGFYASHASLLPILRRVFARSPLLKHCSVSAVLQFHEDMEGYHLRNNGLLFTNSAGSGDHLLWGFVSIRVTATLLLRLLWQLGDGPRVAIARVFQAKGDAGQQVSMVLHGLWSDASKLLEEATSKVGVLTQLQELRAALLAGQPIQLPFRPSMLEGYIALHSKHLRLAMRVVVEVVELLSWLAGQGLVRPQLLDQSARTTSFLLATTLHAHATDALAFTWHHARDNQRLVAHLVLLVVRCAGFKRDHEQAASPMQYWRLVQDGAREMLRFLGDVEVHRRWAVTRAAVQLEMNAFLGAHDDDKWEPEPPAATGEPRGVKRDGGDEEEEMHEDDALARLERQHQTQTQTQQAAYRLRSQLGSRFVSALAKDGRFDADSFLNGSARLLALPDGQDDFALVGRAWMALFQDVVARCQDVVALQASMDELLADVADEFLDPLLNTIMTDPVRLPSGNIVDRGVIERHLLSANRVDPFTREPLTLAMLTPCDALRQQIQKYLRSKLQHLAPQKEDVLATWGLGWDAIFEVPPK